MAVDAKQSVCILCGDFQITDVTGPFNDPDNLTGYGAPNAEFGTTIPYTAAITAPKATTPAYTLDLNAAPPLPDSEGHYEYIVSQEDLGFEGQDDIPSGVWTVDIEFGGVRKSLKLLAFGDIKSKIRKCICCDGVKNIWLHMTMKGAEALFACNKFDEAQKVIDQLYRDTKACCGCQ